MGDYKFMSMEIEKVVNAINNRIKKLKLVFFAHMNKEKNLVVDFFVRIKMVNESDLSGIALIVRLASARFF